MVGDNDTHWQLSELGISGPSCMRFLSEVEIDHPTGGHYYSEIIDFIFTNQSTDSTDGLICLCRLEK